MISERPNLSRRRILQVAGAAGIIRNDGWTTTAAQAGPGEKEWRFEPDRGHNLRGSPTVVDGTVYIGVEGSSVGSLYAVDADTGTADWRFTTDDDLHGIDLSDPVGGRVTSPTVVGNTVYVGIGPQLRAIDATTGNGEWYFETNDTVYSSPTVANGTVYIGSADHNLYAVDAATGEEKWRFETDDFVWSSPTIVDETVYIGSQDGHIYAIDTASGAEKWRFDTGKEFIRSSPTVADGIVYIGTGALVAGSTGTSLYAVDATTGEEVWQFETDDRIPGSPTVANGTVYIGSLDDYLYAIDVTTGNEEWRFDTDDDIWSSPTAADGIVCIANRWSGQLYGVDADTGEENWRFEPEPPSGEPEPQTSMWSSPTMVDGTVYIGYDDGLYAIDAGVDGSSEGSRVTLGTLGHHHDWADQDPPDPPTTGMLNGEVTDQQEGTIANAILEAGLNEFTDETNTVYVTEIGDDGTYELTLPADRTYRLRVAWRNMESDVQEITIDEDQTQTSDLTVEKPFPRWAHTISTEGAEEGLVSSPTVVDETLYIGDELGALHAFDATTGEKEWSFDTGDHGYIRSSPTVVDGTVYIGSGVYQGPDGYLYAVDAATGEEEWRFETPIFSSPTVVDGTVYIGSGYLYAVDAATGEEEWRFDTTEGVVLSSPTVVDGTVYIGSQDGYIYAIDTASGNEKWRFETDETDSSPTVADETVYIGSNNGTLYAVDATTGTEEWSLDVGEQPSGFAFDSMISSPTVADGTVYIGSRASGSDAGTLYAIDAATGDEHWRFETRFELYDDDAVRSSPTVVADTVYVGSPDGIYAINATTGEEKWYIFSNRVWSSPTVVDGILHIASRAPAFAAQNDAYDNLLAISEAVIGSSEDTRVDLGTLGHHHTWAEKAGEQESGIVTGTVTDTDGDTLPDIDIEITDTDTDDLETTVTTDTNGEYTVELPPGSYELAIDADDYEPFSTEVTVEAETTDTVDVELMPTHPSGVGQDVWEAVTDQNGPDDELTFQDNVDAIQAYHNDEAIDGVELEFQDVIDLIEWYEE